MAQIPTLGRARLPFVFAICALLSCTGDVGTGTPGANDRIQLAVVVAFPSPAAAASAAADPQPIVTIRVTTSVVPPGTQIAQEDFDVDPDASEWTLDIDVPFSDDPNARHLLEFELLNTGDQVEWSGNLGPLTLSPSVVIPYRVAKLPKP